MTLFDLPTVDAVRHTLAIADIHNMHRNVAARLERSVRSVAVGAPDAIAHRHDEYRACLVELAALIDGATR